MDLDLVTIALLYGVLLISLVFHEASHAFFALLGGDRTAYVGGQVTLNPIPHIRREPFGTVILPLLVLFMTNAKMCFGFAHAPYDPVWAYHHPKRAALMSAAGPLANLALAALAFGLLKLLVVTGTAETVERMSPLMMLDPADGSIDGPLVATIRIASTFLLLNVLLLVVNLVPLPPFDGAGVVEGLFPRQTRGLYDLIRGQFILMILGLVVLWQILPEVFFPLMDWITDAL